MGISHSRALSPSKPKNHIYGVSARKNSTILTQGAFVDALPDTVVAAWNSAKSEKNVGDQTSATQLRQDLLPLAFTPIYDIRQRTDESDAFYDFVDKYPEYSQTWILDSLRQTDYSRLDRAGETYVDYMGGCIYPESLVRMHADFLTHNVLGNTHSTSNSSNISIKCSEKAREAVLRHFNASPSEYTVVFTSNASGALKLVGESFPFVAGGKLVIGVDSHNSVNGIREFAASKGAESVYIPATHQGGFDIPIAKDILLQNRPTSAESAPGLFVLTAQSNITNSKLPLSLTEYAASLGYHTVVDGAALAATSPINMSEHHIDAMAVSFYKMFGYPTGVGALIAKKSFLAKLKRPWFSGGNVDIVQVPGSIFTRAQSPYEQFEDGTVNYLQLPAITAGLNFLSAYLPFLPLRLSLLLSYLASSLTELRHDTNKQPVVKILSKLPTEKLILSKFPTRELLTTEEQSTTGFTISLVFLETDGTITRNSFIEYAASAQNISLRTGCMCNPGGASALLGLTTEMQNLHPGMTLEELEAKLARELGVVRISLGLASNFKDVWKVLQFATSLARAESKALIWDKWMELQERDRDRKDTPQ